MLTGLADREVSLWIGSNCSEIGDDILESLIELPWRHVFLDINRSELIARLEAPSQGPLVAKRGFIHVIDGDPSRIVLPQRSMPVFLLAGRGEARPDFENRLRRMTMQEELRRSNVRQLVVVGSGGDIPVELRELWSAGFRTNLIFVDGDQGAAKRVLAWLEESGRSPTATLVALQSEEFALLTAQSYRDAQQDERLIVRMRDELGDLQEKNLEGIDDPDKPILEDYSLILERDLSFVDETALPEEVFNAFFRGEVDDWRPFAAELPWFNNDTPWVKLRSLLRKLDGVGAPENRVAYIMSEPGAGGTTLARSLAFRAAREGYPTLFAKPLPFVPEALQLQNFLNRARLSATARQEGESPSEDNRRYETPWLLVYDRIHWEARDSELRRFIKEFEQAGRPVCVLVVTGMQRELAYFDESKFCALAELRHMLEQADTVELGRHLNRFLRHYNKEKPDWQWVNFQQAHSVRYFEQMAAFWITLSFWLQAQFDYTESIQDWVYRAFKKSADTPEVRRAILQIAALSAERLPMPEELILQGASEWPVHLLLDDRRSNLAPIGLVRLADRGRKFWALAHDILGQLLLNAVFYDPQARTEFGLGHARSPLHLRFLLLSEISSNPMIGERDLLAFGEDFATTVFKIDPDRGRSTWSDLWREVLDALDKMPIALRNGSRVFRHHTAISRRRVAWLDEEQYGVTPHEQEILLRRALEDLHYALSSINAVQGREADINLYNSLANAYFDLVRVRAKQGASDDELAELREFAANATRHAFEENPSNPYVIETHVKSLLSAAEERREDRSRLCVEALEIAYDAIRHDSSGERRFALVDLAERALNMLMASNEAFSLREHPETPTELLVASWLLIVEVSEGAAPTAIEDLPREALHSIGSLLENPLGDGNPQVARLRYQVAVARNPHNYPELLAKIEALVATDFRLTPQLRLEYALILMQNMRAIEADKQFRGLRKLWSETDIFAQVPTNLRWLVDTEGKPRVVTAIAAYTHDHRAMAKVRELDNVTVPYRPQEFGVRQHRANEVFRANVSFGHNGPFLRPVGSMNQ